VQGLNSLDILAIVEQLCFDPWQGQKYSQIQILWHVTRCCPTYSRLYFRIKRSHCLILKMMALLVWTHDTAGHPRRLEASATLLREPQILQESSPYCHNEICPGTHLSFFQFLLGDIILRGKMDVM
jgi:hypothetical protein